MLELFKQVVSEQYEAVFSMMSACIGQCPDEMWFEPVADLKYCQVVFHALFFADAYLGSDVDALRNQPFHIEHRGVFGDYEELEYRKQVLVYEKSFAKNYLQHCRAKAASMINAETEESLQAKSEFEWLKVCRADVHLRNIRHLNHHAAQLSLKLRLLTGEGIAWIGAGWAET